MSKRELLFFVEEEQGLVRCLQFAASARLHVSETGTRGVSSDGGYSSERKQQVWLSKRELLVFVERARVLVRWSSIRGAWSARRRKSLSTSSA